MTKLLSCRYNMDTNRVEARFADGTTLAIDCIAVEDEYGNTPAQRAELDWLLYFSHPMPFIILQYTLSCKQPLYKTFAVQGLQFCNRSSGRVYQMQSSSASFASCSRNAG